MTLSELPLTLRLAMVYDLKEPHAPCTPVRVSGVGYVLGVVNDRFGVLWFLPSLASQAK